jgi:chromosome partitioning protein
MTPAGGHSGVRIIAIVNQKGGVGKSTTAVSLGAALAELGHRVLVVDLDPQGNASTGLGIRHEERDVTVYDVLAVEAPIQGAVVPTPIDNLYAIPSTIDLAGAEIELVSQFSRELRLRKAIEPLRFEGSYDYVFLDCPPSLGLLTVNALAAAEELIVPIQCEYYALEGLGQLLRNVRLVQQNVNMSLRLTGIVMTMFDPRTKLSEQVVAEVRRYFGDRVYQTIIPRTVRLSEAPGFGQPITVYDPSSKGAQSYRDLANEVAARLPDESPLPTVEDVPTVVVPPPEPRAASAPRPLVSPDDVEAAAADVSDEAPTVAEAEVEVEPDLEEPEGKPATSASPPEPDRDPSPPHPEREAEAAAPQPEPTRPEIEAPEPNGDADMSPAVEEGSRRDERLEVAGNGDRSQDEAEGSAASGGGKRLRRLFRRGES